MRAGPPTAGNNLEDHPAVEKIRRREALRFSIRIRPESIEPFAGRSRHILAWDIASLGV
jgi:hypothetical protein